VIATTALMREPAQPGDVIALDRRCEFVHGELATRKLVRQLLDKHQPGAIVHFRALRATSTSRSGVRGFHSHERWTAHSLSLIHRAYWNGLGGTASASEFRTYPPTSCGSLRPTIRHFAKHSIYASHTVLPRPKPLRITWSRPSPHRRAGRT